MPTMTTRFVTLDIAPKPTLEEMIQVIGPISGSGEDISFTIPLDVQTGDVIIGWATLEETEAYINDASTIADFYYSGAPIFASDISANSFDPDGGFLITFGAYPLAADAGETLELNIWYIDSNSPEAPTNYDFPFDRNWVLFAVHIKKEKITSPQIGNIFTYGGSGIDDYYHTHGVYTVSSPTAHAYTSGAPIERDNQVVLFTSVTYGGNGITPGVGETELCDISVGNMGLFVSARVYNTSFGDDTGEHNFNSGSIYHTSYATSAFTYPGISYP